MTKETTQAEFSELIGETIEAFEAVESAPGMWPGDDDERYMIKTASGKVFYLQTGGGTNTFGLPGSQAHWIALEKPLNQEG